MNRTFALMLCGIALTSLAAGAEARGRHGHSHSHFGVYFGAPLWHAPLWHAPPPYYRYDPYYYQPRTIIIEREPPVYIQRPPVSPAPAPATQTAPTAQVWFYCTDPAGYYPHVPQCSQPWVSVDPRTVQAAPGP